MVNKLKVNNKHYFVVLFGVIMISKLQKNKRLSNYEYLNFGKVDLENSEGTLPLLEPLVGFIIRSKEY